MTLRTFLFRIHWDCKGSLYNDSPSIYAGSIKSRVTCPLHKPIIPPGGCQAEDPSITKQRAFSRVSYKTLCPPALPFVKIWRCCTHLLVP